MEITQTYTNELTYKFLKLALKFTRFLGPGLFENVDHNA